MKGEPPLLSRPPTKLIQHLNDKSGRATPSVPNRLSRTILLNEMWKASQDGMRCVFDFHFRQNYHSRANDARDYCELIDEEAME